MGARRYPDTRTEILPVCEAGPNASDPLAHDTEDTSCESSGRPWNLNVFAPAAYVASSSKDRTSRPPAPIALTPPATVALPPLSSVSRGPPLTPSTADPLYVRNSNPPVDEDPRWVAKVVVPVPATRP